VSDRELIAKKLARIETSVHEIETLGRPEEIGRDVREERFLEHTLQIAIQAVIDIASHIVSDERLGEPDTNRELFQLLATHGWISEELAETLRSMAGFRNVLVHGYDTVDLGIVREVVAERLGDLLEFATTIRGRL
jgi:uncharacterized protein YutE (UPF0331/DUF86 family)